MLRLPPIVRGDAMVCMALNGGLPFYCLSRLYLVLDYLILSVFASMYLKGLFVKDQDSEFVLLLYTISEGHRHISALLHQLYELFPPGTLLLMNGHW